MKIEIYDFAILEWNLDERRTELSIVSALV